MKIKAVLLTICVGLLALSLLGTVCSRGTPVEDTTSSSQATINQERIESLEEQLAILTSILQEEVQTVDPGVAQNKTRLFMMEEELERQGGDLRELMELLGDEYMLKTNGRDLAMVNAITNILLELAKNEIITFEQVAEHFSRFDQYFKRIGNEEDVEPTPVPALNKSY